MADFNIEKAIAEKKAQIAVIQRKLSIVKKGKPTMDTDALDEQGYRDAATAYGERDPATAFNLIAKADALKAKREERVTLTQQQKAAAETLDNAVRAWSANKEDPMLQAEVYKAQTELRRLGVPTKDYIQNYAAEKQAGVQTELKKMQMESDEAQKAFQRVMAEKQLGIDYAKLGLERQKMLAEGVKATKGETLDSETIAKVSNLQTVKQSTAEIRSLVNSIRNGGATIQNARELNNAVKIAIENLGRTQSGGAITTDEVGLFNELVGFSTLDLLDKGDAYMRRLDRLDRMIDNKLGNYQTKGRSITGGTDNAQKPKPPIKTSNGRTIE